MTSSPSPTVPGRGRICFFVPNLHPAMRGAENPFVGGTEVRTWLLARTLAAKGFEVAFATQDYGQAPAVRHSGVTLLRTYPLDAGLPGVRLLYPRLWRSLRTLRRAGADAYIAAGAGLAAGWAHDAAKLRNSRFVFLAAHDTDAISSLPYLATRRERWWYRRALFGASARVAQTEHQRELFLREFGLDAEVIPNPVELPTAAIDVGANDMVVWLSTYKRAKRPDWFVELARRLPQYRFRMVGMSPTRGDDDSWRAAKDAASSLPNLDVRGVVEHSRIGEIFGQAGLFVFTSPAEGFSNALLEAWSYGIPCVATVDSGGAIARHGMGEAVDSLDELTDSVARMMDSPERRRELGFRAREYVERYHGPEQTIEPLAALLDRVIEGTAHYPGQDGSCAS